MIISFKCDKTRRLFDGDYVASFSGVKRQAEKRLRILDAADTLQALRALKADTLQALRALPGNRFETLVGDRVGQYSIRINKQWRICFTWDKGAHQVEIVDYH